MNVAALLESGSAHHRAGRFREAEIAYRQALAIDSHNAEAWHLLGMIADAAGQTAAAVEHIRQALALSPHQPRFLNNLGTIHIGERRLDLAEECFLQAIRLQPDFAAAHNNLAEAYKAQGDVTRALECYRRAVELQPDFPECASNMLMVSNYDPALTTQQLEELHRKFGPVRSRGIRPTTQFGNDPSPERKLRIGYVSPDFKLHAVASFFEPILRGHDPASMEVYLYAEVARPDPISDRLRSMAHAWRSTVGVAAADVAAMIRADGIDLLIDLAGHTRGNRLDVFAFHPAPIQATYLGYPHRTGVDAIDVRLTDAVIEPTAEPTGPERRVHIPGGFCVYQPAGDAPAVGGLPSLRTGAFTFGSHHQPAKLSPQCLAAWKRILDEAPDGRLLMTRETLSPTLIEKMRRRLAEIGFDLSRVEFREASIRDGGYWRLYEEIDLALDAFPYNGHTTTCEALWMGVPTVTLLGDRPAGRVGASVMTAISQERFIASSIDEYVQIAVHGSRSREALAEIRQGLRDRLRATLCDAPAFARRLEGVYRDLWRRWCASRQEGSSAPAASSASSTAAAAPDVSTSNAAQLVVSTMDWAHRPAAARRLAGLIDAFLADLPGPTRELLVIDATPGDGRRARRLLDAWTQRRGAASESRLHIVPITAAGRGLEIGGQGGAFSGGCIEKGQWTEEGNFLLHTASMPQPVDCHADPRPIVLLVDGDLPWPGRGAKGPRLQVSFGAAEATSSDSLDRCVLLAGEGEESVRCVAIGDSSTRWGSIRAAFADLFVRQSPADAWRLAAASPMDGTSLEAASAKLRLADYDPEIVARQEEAWASIAGAADSSARERLVSLLDRSCASAFAASESDARSFRVLARLFFLLGDLPRSARCLEQAIECGDVSHRAKTYFNLGLCRRRQNDLPAARAAFEQAALLDPADAAAKDQLASIST